MHVIQSYIKYFMYLYISYSKDRMMDKDKTSHADRV